MQDPIPTRHEVPMFLDRRTQEAAPQDQRELTNVELAEVTGGVICSRDPAMQAAMWMATGFLPGTPNGQFLCWG